MTPRVLALVVGLGFSGSLAAQEEVFDDPSALEADAAPEVNGQDLRFLEAQTRVGGRFWAGFSSQWDTESDREFTNDLGADFTLDSRPSADFRVFSKVRVEAPFEDAQVRELFADFTWGPTLLRVGKQSIKAGVGPFFSPADALSLEAVDPEDPDAERTGPTSAKARWSWDTTNLTAAVVSEGAQTPDDLGAWAQVEAVWGPWEGAVSGFFRQDQGWRAATTVSGALWGASLFAEAVVIGDSPKAFVTGTGSTYEVDERPLVVSWTGGWKATLDEVHLTWTAQYYFNGLGTDDSPELARWLVRRGTLAADDLDDWGRHQAASSVFFDNLGATGLDAGLVWTANLGDTSGRLTPRISWTAPGDPVTVEVRVPWTYGAEGSEFAPEGDTWALAFEVRLGNGSF